MHLFMEPFPERGTFFKLEITSHVKPRELQLNYYYAAEHARLCAWLTFPSIAFIVGL
jgi:hypothetical protein